MGHGATDYFWAGSWADFHEEAAVLAGKNLGKRGVGAIGCGSEDTHFFLTIILALLLQIHHIAGLRRTMNLDGKN